jgi:hypothetical protein
VPKLLWTIWWTEKASCSGWFAQTDSSPFADHELPRADEDRAEDRVSALEELTKEGKSKCQSVSKLRRCDRK